MDLIYVFMFEYLNLFNVSAMSTRDVAAVNLFGEAWTNFAKHGWAHETPIL